jgi:hypothetical protein
LRIKNCVLNLQVVPGTRFADLIITIMNTKPDPNTSKTSPSRPVRKSAKGATETSRLFLDVNDTTRRTQALPLTRYVE